jgi:hypothetical protein
LHQTRNLEISAKSIFSHLPVPSTLFNSVPSTQAGMIFYNDEGTENGGLIFGGRRNERGEVIDSGGSLSFDKYGTNQIVQLAGVDDKNDRFAGLTVKDRNRRIWVGRTDDGTAAVSLMDANGRKRIVMQVTEEGSPSLTFLDDKGHTVQRLVPAIQP